MQAKWKQMTSSKNVRGWAFFGSSVILISALFGNTIEVHILLTKVTKVRNKGRRSFIQNFFKGFKLPFVPTLSLLKWKLCFSLSAALRSSN